MGSARSLCQCLLVKLRFVWFLLRAVLESSRPRVQVRSDSEFRRTWLQQVGCCADSSFTSGISVTGRGLVARSDGKKGREVGSYECGVDRISQR